MTTRRHAAPSSACSLGALAGFAVGMFVAQRVGGFSGLASSVRRATGGRRTRPNVAPAVADDFERATRTTTTTRSSRGRPSDGLEERVLEAFRNDPILARARGRHRRDRRGHHRARRLGRRPRTKREHAVTHRARRSGRRHRRESHRRSATRRSAFEEHARRVARGRRRAHRSALGRQHGRHRPSPPGHVGRDRTATPTPSVELEERWTSADERAPRGRRRHRRASPSAARRAKKRAQGRSHGRRAGRADGRTRRRTTSPSRREAGRTDRSRASRPAITARRPRMTFAALARPQAHAAFARAAQRAAAMRARYLQPP